LGLEVRTPVSLKNTDEQRAFAELNADAAVVVAYGLILPKAILDAPKLGCFNIHASLLPRWRGAAPIQRAIEAGDPRSGVTIMRMDEGLDTGPKVLVDAVDITPDMNAEQLHDALSDMGARLIVEALAGVADGTLTAQPQPDDGVTYAQKIHKAETRIDWNLSAEAISAQVRAFYPLAWFERDGQRVRVCSASVEPGSGTPGAVLDGQLLIACGVGAVRLIEVQPAGKNVMSADAYVRGNPLRTDEKFV
jgi:methionyl-tRNA formyltransferase